MESDFVKNGRAEMNDFVVKAIDDLLSVLDSRIQLPTDKHGFVLENKLFAVVQSREQVYTSACALMDLIKLEDSADQNYKNKIIEGLKTTWHELTIIATRDIGSFDELLGALVEDDDEEREERRPLSKEEKRRRARETVTDDYMSSISKAKELSARVAFAILDRIALLENPEAINDEIINRKQTSNIVERYVENP